MRTFRFWSHTIGYKGLFLVLVLLSVGSWFLRSDEPQHTLTIGETTWQVEYVKTPREREQGLSQRKTLSPRQGMLFLFETLEIQRFWMKGMLFPIDIIFIQDERVVSIERRIQSSDERIFSSPVVVDRVLEMNAGEADALRVGDTVTGLP